MLAVNGYYDGNVCLVEERVSKKPQKVIITFLDDFTQKKENSSTREEKLQALKDVQSSYDSAVSYMELLQGALNKQELFGIKKFLEKSETKIIPMNEEITHRAMEYVENYALSDSMELADALIAATAIENDETLCTANGKHYKCVPDLQMDLFKVD